MTTGERSSDRAWYTQVRPTYVALAKVTAGTLKGLLDKDEIHYLSIDRRAKRVDSFVGKISRKSYKDPRKEIHDLAGVRIIVFTESDVSRVVDLVKASLQVHPDKSLDKSDELGVDRAGYRSVHLVCDLGSARCKLPEYRPYKGLLVEIQVRTVLQHAWAEIEHDRNYKFGGVLPTGLQRRLYLAAGTLEMVDREFDSIANAIDAYSEQVEIATRQGQLEIPINSTSLVQFLATKYSDRVDFGGGFNADEDVISELTAFGIDTLEDLERLITDDFLALQSKHEGETTDSGFVRSLMMYHDITRYFEDCWQEHWGSLDRDGFELLAEKYGHNAVMVSLGLVGVYIEPD